MRFTLLLISAFLAVQSWAQAMFFSSATEPDSVAVFEEEVAPVYESVYDSLMAEAYAPDTVVAFTRFPRNFFLPAVFSSYEQFDSVNPFAPNLSGNPALRWVEEANASADRQKRLMQSVLIANPATAKYNAAWMPEPYKQYEAVINPLDHTITISEAVAEIPKESTFDPVEINKRHWLRNFNASLQFSQAFVSPNWYQGGNNNLNALLNLYYNVKLNQKFHPKLLFESTFQYKLGINSAPDDSLRSYNISEDVLQINSVFGYKAAKRWYYSVTGQFKTQVVNSYTKNTNTLRAAFLSPAELNIGLGMTYNYANPPKTFSVDVSLSPLTYNMKMCTNSRLNVANYGIDPGHTTVHKFGSSAECKIAWKIAHNISLASRIFAFTDYDRLYTDWENSLVFEINKFLVTQLFWYMRYDTDTPHIDDTKWKKLQLKEILSIGFTYKFSTT